MQNKMNNHLKLRAILSWTLCLLWLPLTATPQFISFSPVEHALPVILDGQPLCIAVDKTDDEGIHIAVTSLQHDFQRVCGKIATAQCGPSKKNIIIGSIGKSTLIQQLIKSKKIDADALIGKREKYIIQIVDSQLVIAGSDMRGTIYGIYELSRQMGGIAMVLVG
jgi:alpha-glucuronidase